MRSRMSRSGEWAAVAAVCAAIAATGVVLFRLRAASPWLEDVSLAIVVAGVMGCLVFGLVAWVVRK